MKIGEIVKEYRKTHKLTMQEFADKIEKSKGYISMLEKGANPQTNKPITPTLNTLKKIAEVMNISLDDLLLKLDKNQDVKLNPTTPQAPMASLTSENKEKAITYINSLLAEQEAIIDEPDEPEELYEVNTVSELAAGYGFDFDDYDCRTVTVANEPPRHDLASRVRGDSMLPDYEDGEIVYLVDVGVSRYSGQVCAVVVNDKTYIKKVYTEPNGLRLVSINPDENLYPDIIIDFPPAEDVHIKIFRVVGKDKVVKR